MNISNIDILIMILYAVFIIGYGLYHAKRDSSEEYFLAGRNMIWPIVGISLFAANISSSTLVGLASSAFQTDTHVFNYEWLAAVVLVFFSIFFLPFYLRSRVYTMPEFLERRYDSRSRYYFSAITIVGNVLIDTAAGLYVGNIILQLLFPSLSPFVIIIILAVAAAAYTIPGGLNSVVQTEVIQAILLVFGSILLTYFAFDKIGGWDAMIAGLNERAAAGQFAEKGVSNAREILSMFRPTGEGWQNFITGKGGDGFMPWTGLVLGAPILGFYFWANNQFMVQRVLSAKSIDHGRWGALFAGFLKLPVIFFMVLPGTVAILLYSDMNITEVMNYTNTDGTICERLMDCPNATYPMLVFDLLPKGILGLVLAGLLAAMMSSVSATFNSASTLVTMDFVKKLRPDISSKGLVRVGQMVTLILVVLAVLWIPFIDKVASSLFEYLQIVLAYICPPVAATFIVGMFWKRSNANGAFTALMCGFVIAILAVIASVQVEASGEQASALFRFLASFHFLHFTFFLFVVCALINIVVSLMGDPPPPEKLEGYTYTKKIFQDESVELAGVAWYKNYRYIAIGLLLTTVVLLYFFS